MSDKLADVHRCTPAVQFKFRRFPKSIFRYLTKLCADGGNEAIHRCFSIARMYGSTHVLREKISIEGFMKEDLENWKRATGKEPESHALRFSFWKTKPGTGDGLRLDGENIDAKLDQLDLIGYMILEKVGAQRGDDRFRWIVYEAVLDGGEFQRGIVPRQTTFLFSVGVNGKRRKITGRLYCQQNGVTTVCAHVAIRTLLTALLPEGDVSYRQITDYANESSDGLLDMKEGMTSLQLEHVFKKFGFVVHSWGIPEDRMANEERNIPVYHCVYSAVESGGGCLLGFFVTRKDDKKPKNAGSKTVTKTPQHIIPLFGHTFNKHIWVNDASGCYFNAASPHDIAAFTSDNWVSTFQGHDDNIGPNIYIPRFFIEKSEVSTVFSIIPVRKEHAVASGYYNGVDVERVAPIWLINYVGAWIRKQCCPDGKSGNMWLQKLLSALPTSNLTTGRVDSLASDGGRAKVVLRSLFVQKDEYLKWLEDARDWMGKKECESTVDEIKKVLSEMEALNKPASFWMVEFSLPHLFPANERKIGEMLFSAVQLGEVRGKEDILLPLITRIPGYYLSPVLLGTDGKVKLDFDIAESAIVSHTECFEYKRRYRIG